MRTWGQWDKHASRSNYRGRNVSAIQVRWPNASDVAKTPTAVGLQEVGRPVTRRRLGAKQRPSCAQCLAG